MRRWLAAGLAGALAAGAGAACSRAGAYPPGRPAARGPVAYVVNSGSGTVTVIGTATNRPQATIRVGRDPVAVAVTPDGKAAFVVSEGSGSVTPVWAGTNAAGRPVKVGWEPRSIALSPDGRTAYVASDVSGYGVVTPSRPQPAPRAGRPGSARTRGTRRGGS